MLLNEINTRIRKLRAEGGDGRLKADLSGVVFLIGKLPRQEGADDGVRADAPTLADLLLDDIERDSGAFRTKVERTLETLADEGVLMRMADEYRIQTREGTEWERAFREERTRLTRSEVEIARLRDHLLGEAVQKEVRGMRPAHGKAMVRRRLLLHFGAEAPTPVAEGGGDAVQVWVRDGWSCSEAEVLKDARKMGMEDAVLHVHLPKRSADELLGHITSAEAAKRVLAARGVPSSPEGKEARASMRSRRKGAEGVRERIVDEIARAAQVFQGGGGEVYGEGLQKKIESGAESSLARLFPRFPDGDHRAWAVALKRIRQGSGTPFGAVGWQGKVTDHAVAKEVAAKVGSGKSGAHVRKKLEAAPYGWPRDAIDAALLGLLADGHLRAERNGESARVAALTQQLIPKTRFLPESVRLTVSQRLEIRQLFQGLGVGTRRSGEEAERAPEFLAKCRDLARAAGGNPPLPQTPDLRFIEDLSGLTGNEQLAAILKERERIETSAARWKKLGERARQRSRAWDLATALHGHADGELSDVADEAGQQLDAIRSQRTLLDDIDHAGPCVARLGDSLRGALSELRKRLAVAVEAATTRLAADATWRKLSASDRSGILRKFGLTTPWELRVGTNEDLRAELDARGLAAWRSEIDAVPRREAKALAEAGKRGRGGGPGTVKRVRVRRGTLSNAEAVRKWLTEHEQKLMKAVRDGAVIVE